MTPNETPQSTEDATNPPSGPEPRTVVQKAHTAPDDPFSLVSQQPIFVPVYGVVHHSSEASEIVSAGD